MALPIITNTSRVAVDGVTPGGAPWANVSHFRWTAAGSPAAGDFINLNADVQKYYNGPAYAGGAYVLQWAKATCTMARVSITPLDGTSTTMVFGSAGVGLQADFSLPSEDSLVLSLRTTKRGRSYRGRIFFPPYTVSTFDAAGTANAARVALTLTNWSGFKTALNGHSWEQVVASYLHSTAETITTVTMDLKVDVQRRRK